MVRQLVEPYVRTWNVQTGYNRLPGDIAYEWYIKLNWDENSSLSDEEQHRRLGIKYIRLGRQGRKRYVDLVENPGFSGIVVIPRNRPALLDDFGDTYEVHFQEMALDTSISEIAIRTWFGDHEYTKAESDAMYKRVGDWTIDGWDLTYQSGGCFEMSSISHEKLSHGYEATLEEWALSFLPGIMDYDWSYREGEDDEKAEHVALAILDKEALVNGWFCVVAVNHKAERLGMVRVPLGMAEEIWRTICPQGGGYKTLREITGFFSDQELWYDSRTCSYTSERPALKAPGWDDADGRRSVQ
ncbi:hypothetical protein ABW19_dt0200201 [Dactylella cylindrospora]|nr:hypothetical protein ABW19_dt0200201 [Dactylella cylindrospora]